MKKFQFDFAHSKRELRGAAYYAASESLLPCLSALNVGEGLAPPGVNRARFIPRSSNRARHFRSPFSSAGAWMSPAAPTIPDARPAVPDLRQNV